MFKLQPVVEADFDNGGPNLHRATVTSPRPAAEVWSELHSETPLHWCKGIKRVEWTSPAPRGVGATRQVTVANGLKVQERYFLWQEREDEYLNAFSVEEANLPLFNSFGERYRVVPTATGSEFTWEFYAEPKGPGPARAVAHKLLARDVAAMERDCRAHLG